MTQYKQSRIMKIGQIVRSKNPQAIITSKEIEQLRKKSVKQLDKFIIELKKTK